VTIAWVPPNRPTTTGAPRIFAGRVVLEVACPRFQEALGALEREPWVLEASVFGTRIHLVVADEADGRRAATDLLQRQGNVPATVDRIVPSLEDVFIHYIETGDSRRAAPEAAP